MRLRHIRFEENLTNAIVTTQPFVKNVEDECLFVFSASYVNSPYMYCKMLVYDFEFKNIRTYTFCVEDIYMLCEGNES